jgi:predicted site-specific integrase-resolvase
MRLLADPSVQTIVVEHRDRLMRFGCEYVEAAQGRRLAVSAHSLPEKAIEAIRQ